MQGHCPRVIVPSPTRLEEGRLAAKNGHRRKQMMLNWMKTDVLGKLTEEAEQREKWRRRTFTPAALEAAANQRKALFLLNYRIIKSITK